MIHDVNNAKCLAGQAKVRASLHSGQTSAVTGKPRHGSDFEETAGKIQERGHATENLLSRDIYPQVLALPCTPRGNEALFRLLGQIDVVSNASSTCASRRSIKTRTMQHTNQEVDVSSVSVQFVDSYHSEHEGEERKHNTIRPST